MPAWLPNSPGDHYSHTVRIVSLVPSATEMLFALGLQDEILAVTHECDYPPQVLGLPKLTRDALPSGLTAGQIDAAVRARTDQGKAIYELDSELLHELAPDLIVTQALCPVCAVSYDDVCAVAQQIPSKPQVISLDPHTLDEVIGDARALARATDRRDAGVAFVRQASSRIDRVRRAVGDQPRRRVAALEWLEPVYVAGHWTPQLIEYAGGVDVLGMAGEHSQRRSWEEVLAAKPEIVVLMPCGYDAQRAHEEGMRFRGQLQQIDGAEIFAVDGAAYFSRPGPRLIDGLELLAHILHPDRIAQAPAEALRL
jgi:iron complex transport system substrate-binding protein